MVTLNNPYLYLKGTCNVNVTDPATGKVTGVSQNTEESAAEELSQWKTKRDRGDGYGMNPQNEWY